MSSVGLEEQLTKAAQDVRRAIVAGTDFDWFPRGCCQFASRILGLYLIRELKLVPVEIVCNGTRYLQDKLDEFDRPVEQSHAWLEVGGFIIDITADQFYDCDEQVIVTVDRSWHDGFAGQTRHSEDDILGSNDYTQEHYRKMLPFIRGER